MKDDRLEDTLAACADEPAWSPACSIAQKLIHLVVPRYAKLFMQRSRTMLIVRMGQNVLQCFEINKKQMSADVSIQVKSIVDIACPYTFVKETIMATSVLPLGHVGFSEVCSRC
jgi:hypothetical protein